MFEALATCCVYEQVQVGVRTFAFASHIVHLKTDSTLLLGCLHSVRTPRLSEISSACMSRIGQDHIYTVYIR